MIPIRPGIGARNGSPIVRGPMQGGPAGMQGPMSPRVIQSMKKGGKVKKTGLYKLHKGETVKKAKSKTDHRPAKGDSHAYVYGRKA